MALPDYQRLIEVAKFANCETIKDLAEKLDMTKQNLYELKKPMRYFSRTLARRIRKYFPEINEEWLVSGALPMTGDKKTEVHEPQENYGKCIHCEAMRETIEVQKKLISRLEKDLEKVKPIKEKRKAG